jgi:pilus retraction protein PilT
LGVFSRNPEPIRGAGLPVPAALQLSPDSVFLSPQGRATATAAAYFTPRSLTAAASQIKLNDKGEAERFKARRNVQSTSWQAEAWEYYDAIGEIKYAFNLVASVVSRIRLYAAVIQDPSEAPKPLRQVANFDEDLARAAERALQRLDSAYGGQAGLLRDAALNLAVTGECYLIQMPALAGTGFPESWDIRSVDELGLPDTVRTLIRYHNGLVLVTGPVGCGKSTTLAALVDEINKERQDHIITLEDPIEFVFEPKGCHINQREVHTHTESFASALRGSLREDPDIIMVGEMRDLETIQLALTAAETGHLVLGTLHTGNAPRTLDRVLDVFPTDQRDQIRIMVSESLRGILSQQLVPRADGNGRVLALELLVNTPAVSNCIREGKTYMLPGVMQTGKNVGMITMDESLRKLYVDGLISREDLLYRSDDKAQMKEFLQS